jgi:hypothetical protein
LRGVLAYERVAVVFTEGRHLGERCRWGGMNVRIKQKDVRIKKEK